MASYSEWLPPPWIILFIFILSTTSNVGKSHKKINISVNSYVTVMDTGFFSKLVFRMSC